MIRLYLLPQVNNMLLGQLPNRYLSHFHCIIELLVRQLDLELVIVLVIRVTLCVLWLCAIIIATLAVPCLPSGSLSILASVLAESQLVNEIRIV